VRGLSQTLIFPGSLEPSTKRPYGRMPGTRAPMSMLSVRLTVRAKLLLTRMSYHSAAQRGSGMLPGVRPYPGPAFFGPGYRKNRNRAHYKLGRDSPPGHRIIISACRWLLELKTGRIKGSTVDWRPTSWPPDCRGRQLGHGSISGGWLTLRSAVSIRPNAFDSRYHAAIFSVMADSGMYGPPYALV